MIMPKKKLQKTRKIRKVEKTTFQIDKKALIAAVLNFILVGLGYAYLKYYKKAVLMFIVYLIIVLIISYIATFFSPLIWIGLLVNLYFAWNAYKLSLKK